MIATGRLFRALRHPQYRLLFAAFAVNQIGFWVSHISLQGVMVELTGNDPFQLGLLFFFLFAPSLFFSPFAGVVADRYERKTVMLGSYGAVAGLMVLLAGLSQAKLLTPALLLVLAFLLGSNFTLGSPAAAALAANVVGADDLPSAISLQSAANNLTRVLGPALAAPLVASGRFAIAFALFATASLAAASLIARIRVGAGETRTADAGGIVERIRGGLAHARERKPAVAALFTVSTLALFGVSHVTLLPLFAEQALGRREWFAWLVAVAGLGAVFGALATGRRGRPTLGAAAVSLFVYGLALGAFALCREPVLALLAQFVVGYCYFAVMTGLQTLLQQVVDDAKRGRIMSLFQMAWAGLVPIGALTMGAVARPLGVVATLLGAALVCAGVGAVMTVRSRR